MDVLIKGMKMPSNCDDCPLNYDSIDCMVADNALREKGSGDFLFDHERHPNCPLVPVPKHGRLIDADALKGRMERNLWAIEDKAEKELGFDETLRRGMQYGHAVCLDAVNDTTVILGPIIVHCCECEYNNHCLTQAFVEDASKIPFDKNTWFCADAKAAHTIIPTEEGE